MHVVNIYSFLWAQTWQNERSVALEDSGQQGFVILSTTPEEFGERRIVQAFLWLFAQNETQNHPKLQVLHHKKTCTLPSKPKPTHTDIF